MSSLLCNSGTWGSLGSFGIWGGIGWILNLIFWIVLLAGLVLLAVWALRRVQVPAANGQPAAKEILQAQYVRGEISREQYETMKQDVG